MKHTHAAFITSSGKVVVDRIDSVLLGAHYILLTTDTSAAKLKRRVLVHCSETHPSVPGGKDTFHFIPTIRRPASERDKALSLAYWLRFFNDDATLSKADTAAEAARFEAGCRALAEILKKEKKS